MATIQQVNINKLQGQRTFLNLADVLLRRLVNRANDNRSKEVHFVTDTYRDMSIKNAERANRAVNGSQVMRIYGQALPQQWKKFLSNGSNKEFLIEFLFETWSKIKTSEIKGVRVYLAHGSKCHMFSSGSGPDQKVQVNEVDNLNSTQEEADTRMYLHAAFAANTNAATDIIIISPDTDVFIIGISLQSVIGAKLHTGRGINLRTIDLKQIEQSIGNDVSKALIGLHCLTGCDSVSAFYGKGKKRALNLLLKDNELCPAFKDLGERFDIDPDMVISLEKFVCKLYGQKDVETVNEARYNMFRLARKSEIGMPPNQDSLTQHIKRANYQAAIYKRSLQPNAVIPLPDGHGWKTDSNGELIIDWMNRPSDPESVMQLANCTASCKKSGCNDATKCTCLENSIPCTDLCKCARLNCSNVGGQHEIEDDDTESEESDDEED